MKKFVTIALLIFFSFTLSSRSLEEIKKSGVIYAAFTESSFKSINYLIAQEFAKFLNVKLIPVITTWDENFSLNGKIPEDLIQNPNLQYTPDALKKADFICGTIYIYEWRKKLFEYAGILQVSDILVVRNDSKNQIRSILDLKDKKIALMGNSSYFINMTNLNKKLGNSIKIITTESEEQAQELFLKGLVDGFVSVSSLAFEFINKNNKIAKLAFPIGKPVDVGWTVEKNNKGLAEEINNFFETIIGNGTLNKLFQKIYGIDYITYVNIITSYSDATQTHYRTYDDIIASGKLIVAMRKRDMIFQPNSKQLSHKLIEDFAKFLNLKLEIKEITTISEIFAANNGKIYKDSSYTPNLLNEVDIVVDILAPVDWRLNKVDIIGYFPNAIIVVGPKNLKINTITDLKKYRGVTEKGTSYENIFQTFGITNYGYAKSSELLSLVEKGIYQYTLVSIDIYELYKYQNLEAKFIIGEVDYAGWAIKKNDPKLKQKILEFFDYQKTSGILDKYFKEQTSLPFKAAEKFLFALYQTYNLGFFPITEYNSSKGLVNEKVNKIFQDKNGHIWFGTDGGAILYNGRKMITYDTAKNLLSNYVLDINQDKDGKIYFATLRGISILYKGQINNILTNNSFSGIYIDEKNNKFFIGYNKLYLLTNNNNIVKILDNNIEIGAVHNIVKVANSNKYLISSEKGIFSLDIEKNKIEKITSEPTNYLFIDIDKNLWISTPEALYYTNIENIHKRNTWLKLNEKLNVKSQIKKIFQTKDEAIWLVSEYMVYQIFSINLSTISYNSQIGLRDEKINDFFVDNEDNMWFAYDIGANKLANRSLRNIFPNIIKSNIKKIEIDINGNLWLLANNKIYKISDTITNIFQANKQIQEIKTFFLRNDSLYFIDKQNIYLYTLNNHSLKKILSIFDKINSINDLFISSNKKLYLILNDQKNCAIIDSNKLFLIKTDELIKINQITEIDQLIYIATSNGIATIDFDKKTLKYIIKTNFGINTIKKIQNQVFVGTENGLFIFKNHELKQIPIRFLTNTNVQAISNSINSKYIWLGTLKGIYFVNLDKKIVEFVVDSKDGLNGTEIITDGIKQDEKGFIWILTKFGLNTFDIKKISNIKTYPIGSIEKIVINSKEYDTLPKVLKYSENNITFELSGLSFKNEEAIVYDYYLRGRNKIYESLSQIPYIAAYQNLPYGNYTFLYRTKGKDGIWSYYQAINFTISKPWWLKWWAISLSIVLVFIIIYTIIKLREKTLKARNRELELIVEQRTKEIVRQKAEIEEKNAELQQQQEEILAQRDELAKQKEIAEQQRDQIAKQKEEIMDSIYYAKRIQNAILPPAEILDAILPEHFILYLPRDIVSGDFYWIKKLGNKIIVATADCTGHGVPGAFMSMLGVSLLNEIVLKNSQNLSTAKILEELRTAVVNSLHQTGKLEETKDGMDMSLYIFDIETKILQFSGAFNSMLICRGEEIIELPADKMPIGIFEEKTNKPFNEITFKLQQGDLLYTYSDGYASQFGGPEGKKFKQTRFQKLLLTIKDKNMKEQKNILDITLKTWMGVKYSQVDDILVIGVKFVW